MGHAVLSCSSLSQPVWWIHLVMQVALLLARPTCTNQDAIMQELTKDQFGKPMSCSEMYSVMASACSDRSFSEVCCESCEGGDDGSQQMEAVSHQLANAASLVLRTGRKMPSIALGTSGLEGAHCTSAVEYALHVGYRAIDTALFYRNHVAIANGIRASGLSRDEVFLISKIPPSQGGYERTAKAVSQMLDEFQTTYMDLCLIHYPGARFSFEDAKVNAHATTDAAVIVERAGTWRQLEQAYHNGYCRQIGVSNYMPRHLEELLDYAVVPPAVNQIEFHPYLVDHKTMRFCRNHNIVVQAYGSINAQGLLDDPVVSQIAKEVSRSTAQVLLRWALQEGVMVLPRSGNKQRILSNAQLWDFYLTAAQQQSISSLHRSQRDYMDPDLAPTGTYTTRRDWAKWRTGRNATTHRIDKLLPEVGTDDENHKLDVERILAHSQALLKSSL